MPVIQPTIAPAAGPVRKFPGAEQPLTLPAGTGSNTGVPSVAARVVDAGITFSVMFSVVAPPGRTVPPAEPVPPAPFQTVVTGIENMSSPVKPGVGGVYT